MRNLKLTIDLLPKGAWDTNLSKTLPQKEWDTLRHAAYERANNKCSCCKKAGEQLEAHEVWNFDIPSKTQTLTDISALCKNCHLVKHMRHTTMIGLDKAAKEHFLKVNNCSPNEFASHFLEAEILFNERSEIDKWNMDTSILEKFTGK